MSKRTAVSTAPIVGRLREIELLRGCFQAAKNVLIEGPVGVGKTRLALELIREMKLPSFRVDGDGRFTEQKLTGWFDPPAVLKKGYSKSAFSPGPLVQAMEEGGVLFINELNRLPESVQNVLLPAIDERMVEVPKLGRVIAKPGFRVVATQNPKEFVATSHLSEAILDRFELVILDYQSEEDERQIVRGAVGTQAEAAVEAAVALARLTRHHPRVRRGASVRAALSVAELTATFQKQGQSFDSSFRNAVRLALPTRIEIEREGDGTQSFAEELDALLMEWADKVLKKKT